MSSKSSGFDFSAGGTNDSKQAGAVKPVKPTGNAGSAELALSTGLYKSSFFKLQLDELITESKPLYDKQLGTIRDTLHDLKDLIESLPERPPKPALEAEKEMRQVHDVAVPYPEPRPVKDSKYQVSFTRPANVNVVGSFALRTGLKTAAPYVVDMSVTLPSSIFQEKDYTNYRYFHKRAYYVACLAAGIKSKKSTGLELKFDLQDGDALRPTLVLQPSSTAMSSSTRPKFQIRIITAIDDSLFLTSRTLPMKANIRHGLEGGAKNNPTPFYNSCIRSEATVALYHKLLTSAAEGCDSFRDACLLGRIWLKQRGFGSSICKGGFGGFEWSVLISLLLEGGGPGGKPALLKSYSSYQIFKATMQFLTGKDLTEPLLFSASDIWYPSRVPVVYDGKRSLNVLYKMTPWSYCFLRREAGTTLNMLNESRDDNFEKVFVYKIDEPLLRFDRLVTIPVTETGDALAILQKQHDIYEVLFKALGDRANLVYLSSSPHHSWSVEAKGHRKTARRSLFASFLLNSENAARVVDHGPFAEEKEAAALFRAFWGEKAELRRFKDGTIRESLVWSEDPSSSIVYQILLHVLQRHFGYSKDNIGYLGDEFDEQLRKKGDGVLSYSESPFQSISNAFQTLEKSIQTMDGVPLTVRHLAPASPLLRYTALHMDQNYGTAATANVVLQFESSARWPDDLVAIQMTKIALLVKLGDALTEFGDFVSAQVGLENEQNKVLNTGFLDVAHVSGVILRLRIHHDREQTLLERRVKEQGASTQTKQEIAYALSAYKRDFIQCPRLSQSISTLCTRFPLLSPTIRLLKYWFSRHLFDGHVHEELIELLAVQTFTQPYPWEPPSSVMTGFLRTLHSISRWDWQQEPMSVDLGGELDNNTIEAIRTRFAAWRSIDPAMNSVSMFVGSDVDPEGVTWTQYEMPSKVVAARICTLAKAVMKLVREQGPELDVSQLFLPALEPYDFVIHLNSKLLQERSASVTKFKNLNTPNSDPARASKQSAIQAFVRDLKACFSPNILFFHGREDSNIIAGLWNPQALKPKTWSLGITYSTVLEGSDSSVSINRTATLNEVSRLGSGMVTRIDIAK